MLIIPAIDIRGDKCVRLSQGDFARETVYAEDPVEVARRFYEEGAEWIHVVDLDGARTGRPANLGILHQIRAEGIPSKIEYGGGIRTIDSIESALSAGAERVVLGSALAESSEFARLCFKFEEQVIAGIDTNQGKVAVHGWEDVTDFTCVEFAESLVELGCKRIIWTDIATDGMLEGPNISELSQLIAKLPVPVIASGGVSSVEDLLAIAATGAEAAIVGRAIYEGRFSVIDALAALK